MNFLIRKKKNLNLGGDDLIVTLEYLKENETTNELAEYIKNFDKNKIIAKKNNELVPIKRQNIIKFYSNGRYNYCKTNDNIYEIKSRLYEIEKSDNNFLRISKSCVINIRHIKCFDINTTGKMIIRFDDGTEEYVSRRKAREIYYFLDERRI